MVHYLVLKRKSALLSVLTVVKRTNKSCCVAEVGNLFLFPEGFAILEVDRVGLATWLLKGAYCRNVRLKFYLKNFLWN